MANAETLARALGWFSIGLGVAQVAAPKAFARAIGVKGDARDRLLTRLVGVRELVAGAGILTRRRPAGWLWARLAGDAMDLALLAAAFRSKRADERRLAAALAGAAGVIVPDALAAWRLSRRSGPSHGHTRPDGKTRSGGKERPMDVRATITVNRAPDEAYRFWRDFENLPRFMEHVVEVRVTGDGRSRWRAKTPLGGTVEWDAEIVEDRPNEVIAWRSVEGAAVEHAGSVRFTAAPGGRGAEIRVEMRYQPPAGPLGAIGAKVARLWGESPEQQVRDDLRAFKQVLETGEVTQTESTIHGRPHPARPPERAPGAARAHHLGAPSARTPEGAAV